MSRLNSKVSHSGSATMCWGPRDHGWWPKEGRAEAEAWVVSEFGVQVQADMGGQVVSSTGGELLRVSEVCRV